MMIRILAATVSACLLVAPRPCLGQVAAPPEITFSVPMNLTQISSDISKVAVFCVITSSAITARFNKLQKQEEMPVVGGQLVTTMSVVIPATNLDNPVGKPAGYECGLSAFSTSLQRWDVFNATHTVAAFRVTPTPARLIGNFTW